MRYSLSNDHYAAEWPLEETYRLEDITQLVVRYAGMEDGGEREEVLLAILRCFHSYLMKYTDMIQRGHVPVYKGRINQDSGNFLRRFVRRGDTATLVSMQTACKTLHVAFGRLSADEVYNILTGILMRVIKAYDPGYTQKIKLVAEANRPPGIDRRRHHR